MGTVAVVAYGMGNIDSVRRALEVAGATVVVTDDPDDLSDVDRIVLPGVGAFGEAMDNLRSRGLDEALTAQVVNEGVPFLGICLGMQVMAGRGSEHGDHEGLAWVGGSVDRLDPPNADERVPHVGWNEVHPVGEHPILRGVESDRDFYFVHSYAMRCDDPADVAATTPYAGGFTSIVTRPNAVGVQFHPEKSQQAGQVLLQNFLAWTG